MITVRLGGLPGAAPAGQQLAHSRQVQADPLLNGLQRVQRLLAGQQGVGVLFQRLGVPASGGGSAPLPR